MSLATNLADLATRTATEVKSLRTLINGNQANLAALTTTQKTTLVAAINELDAAFDALINDGSTTALATWSSTKIQTQINTAIAGITGAGVPAALDTLKEFADALGNDPNFAGTITTALGNRVRVDAAQGFTTGQKTQGRANIDAVGTAEVGDTTTDFVAIFNAGLL